MQKLRDDIVASIKTEMLAAAAVEVEKKAEELTQVEKYQSQNEAHPEP